MLSRPISLLINIRCSPPRYQKKPYHVIDKLPAKISKLSCSFVYPKQPQRSSPNDQAQTVKVPLSISPLFNKEALSKSFQPPPFSEAMCPANIHGGNREIWFQIPQNFASMACAPSCPSGKLLSPSQTSRDSDCAFLCGVTFALVHSQVRGSEQGFFCSSRGSQLDGISKYL
jgi:hypothetical protein